MPHPPGRRPSASEHTKQAKFYVFISSIVFVPGIICRLKKKKKRGESPKVRTLFGSVGLKKRKKETRPSDPLVCFDIKQKMMDTLPQGGSTLFDCIQPRSSSFCQPSAPVSAVGLALTGQSTPARA